MSLHGQPTELPNGYVFKTPREEWPEQFRRVVEHFEETAEWDNHTRNPSYPLQDDPYVLHRQVSASIRGDGGDEYNWHILFNPRGSPIEREAWIVDGGPLLPNQTAMGAAPDDIVANDRDLVKVGSGQVSVCIALTKVAQIHSRAANWIHSDDAIIDQFDHVLDLLDAEGGASQ